MIRPPAPRASASSAGASLPPPAAAASPRGAHGRRAEHGQTVGWCCGAREYSFGYPYRKQTIPGSSSKPKRSLSLRVTRAHSSQRKRVSGSSWRALKLIGQAAGDRRQNPIDDPTPRSLLITVAMIGHPLQRSVVVFKPTLCGR